MDELIDGNEGPSFFTQSVTVLACVPSFRDPPRGKPSVTITVGRVVVGVEPLTITIADARVLAAGLLIAIASHDDEFAQKLLDENFPDDSEGNFIWPPR